MSVKPMSARRVLILVSLLLSVATGGGSAEARVIPEVRRFVESEIAKQAAVHRLRAEEQLDERDEAPAFAGALESNYALSTFALRIRGEVGFDVGGVANIKVVPTIELFWME